MKNLWNTGWMRLYGATGLLATERAKAMKLESPAREVALASLYYTARNKHVVGLMNPLFWLTIVMPLWHLRMISKWDYDALVYALAAHKLAGVGGSQKLSAGGHDVVGTVLLRDEPDVAIPHLVEASLIARQENRPLHEWALPVARLAVYSTVNIFCDSRDYYKEMSDVEEMAMDHIAKTEPQQASRILALVAEFLVRKGWRERAYRVAGEALAIATHCGARTQVIRLFWLRFRIWAHLI